MIKQPVVVYAVTSAISANTFGVHQIQALAAHGYQVHLVCGEGVVHKELEVYCTEIHIFRQLKRNISLWGDFVSLVKFFLLLKRIKPNIMIYSTPKASLLASIASFLLSINVRVYQIWGLRWQNFRGLKLKLFVFIEEMIIKLSTNSTSVSNSIKRFLDKKITNNSIVVLAEGSTVGVNIDYFFFVPNSNQKNKSFKIGYAGRITSEKGIEKLLRLFQSISPEAKELELELELELIGDVDGSPEYLSKFQESIGHCRNINWMSGLGQQELGIKMQSWDLQVFLSEREGLGNVILEAGACGVPTFCWDMPGTIDAIPPKMKNFLIDFGDIDTMRNSIVEYIKQPLTIGERDKLSQWYVQNFEQRKILQSFTNYINGLLGGLVEK